MKKIKFIKIIILILVIITNLVGCQNDLTTSKQIVKIKVAALDTYIDSEIFQAYQMLHPEVEFELLSCTFEKRDKILDKGVDIIMVKPGNFHQLAKEGKLKSLEGFAKKELGASNLEPSLQKAVRNLGEGTIYGIASKFTSCGMVCNVDLFEKANIPIPKKRMNWEEFFALGTQLTQKLKTPSIIVDDCFNTPRTSKFLKSYAEALNLRMFNPHTKKLELNHAGWKQMFKKVLGLIETGVLGNPKNFENMISFEDGNSPMTMMDYVSFYHLTTESKLNLKAIPMPYNSQTPQVNIGLELLNLFAVSNGSAHEKASQEFLKFLLSETYARNFDEDYCLGPFIEINKQKLGYQEFIQGEFLGVTDMMRLWENSRKVARNLEHSLSNPIDHFIEGKKKTLDEAIDSFSNFYQMELEAYIK